MAKPAIKDQVADLSKEISGMSDKLGMLIDVLLKNQSASEPNEESEGSEPKKGRSRKTRSRKKASRSKTDETDSKTVRSRSREIRAKNLPMAAGCRLVEGWGMRRNKPLDDFVQVVFVDGAGEPLKRVNPDDEQAIEWKELLYGQSFTFYNRNGNMPARWSGRLDDLPEEFEGLLDEDGLPEEMPEEWINE